MLMLRTSLKKINFIYVSLICLVSLAIFEEFRQLFLLVNLYMRGIGLNVFVRGL